MNQTLLSAAVGPVVVELREELAVVVTVLEVTTAANNKMSNESTNGTTPKLTQDGVEIRESNKTKSQSCRAGYYATNALFQLSWEGR